MLVVQTVVNATIIDLCYCQFQITFYVFVLLHRV